LLFLPFLAMHSERTQNSTNRLSASLITYRKVGKSGVDKAAKMEASLWRLCFAFSERVGNYALILNLHKQREELFEHSLK
jgi:hypothetical protein